MRRLPIVVTNKSEFYLDETLSELRDVVNPHRHFSIGELCLKAEGGFAYLNSVDMKLHEAVSYGRDTALLLDAGITD